MDSKGPVRHTNGYCGLFVKMAWVFVKKVVFSRRIYISITISFLVLHFILYFIEYYKPADLNTIGQPKIQQKSVMDTGNEKKRQQSLNCRSNQCLLQRQIVDEYIKKNLEDALIEDKGSGCVFPELDIFAPEVLKYFKDTPKIHCTQKDLVKCYMSTCIIDEKAYTTYKKLKCRYKNIIYATDKKIYYGPANAITGDRFMLNESDYVKITCTWTSKRSKTTWTGYGAGFRSSFKSPKPPPGRENSVNVLILGFDSTSRNGFIRKMPLSYKVLNEELGATVMTGYNVVGDGTPAALLPLLSGKTELELPEARKAISLNNYFNTSDFIFHKMREDGYRTFFFEDAPSVGTFQYRFNGFTEQPTDHYLYPLLYILDRDESNKERGSCVGETPQYQLMINLTEQFHRLDGKHFSFTFIVGISHNDFNLISNADETTAAFLHNLKRQDHLKNTLLIVMGDHGSRYGAFTKFRNTLQGKQEERLPLMAIRLPDVLQKDRPEAQRALEKNNDVLTTPHDVHATILDAVNLKVHWNPYKVKGADLRRGLTLLEPIPRSRTCSEAGIEAHWCACLRWRNVSSTDPMYGRVADAVVDSINHITYSQRPVCAVRKLTTIHWVMKQIPNKALLQFQQAKDKDGYIGSFNGKTNVSKEMYQVKVTASPGTGVFEATASYDIQTNSVYVSESQISRISPYGTEPHCISDILPRLNKYCYCK